MNRATLIIGIALLATAAQKPSHIPVEYRGSWSMDLAYCNFEGDTLDNELYVTADTVGFHAEDHRVKLVKLRKDKILVRYFKMDDATRVAPQQLVLSKDKSMLNNMWHRCSEALQEQGAQ
jgi:hypothetical protein